MSYDSVFGGREALMLVSVTPIRINVTFIPVSTNYIVICYVYLCVLVKQCNKSYLPGIMNVSL